LIRSLLIVAIAPLASCTNKVDLVDQLDDGGPHRGSDASSAGSTCPLYQSSCGGSCLPTSSDPANCGGCNVRCMADEVCFSSACIQMSACPIGLMACSGRCVDPRIDDENCGGCNTPCPTGSGCVEAQCQARAASGGGPASCPTLEVSRPGRGSACPGSLAEATFVWAVCTCGDLAGATLFTTDQFDSTSGPYGGRGRAGGDVGVDGHFSGDGHAEIHGSLFSAMGMLDEETSVDRDLHVGSALMAAKPIVAGSDAFVGGNVSVAPRASLDVRGVLHVTPGATITGAVTFLGLRREAMRPASRPCCSGAQIAIADIVSAHAQDNDDASIGLDPSTLDGPVRPIRLDLPCGRYYLDQIVSDQPIAIVAHGRTELFVGGAGITMVSAPLRISVDPSAELDVFVDSALSTSSDLALGARGTPASMRLYVGGSMSKAGMRAMAISAFVYAPKATIDLGASASTFDVFGALFLGGLKAAPMTAVHYDRAVLRAGASCPTGASTTGATCTSCNDCDRQACVNGMCGGCTDSSECCAPSTCIDGACLPFNL
jgi:stigma-specific protein Stig1